MKIIEHIGQTKHGFIGDPHKTANAYGEDRRVLHACEQCGYVRVVKFTPRLREGVEIGGSVGSARCTACELENKADHYAKLSHINRRRAVEARSRQALRRLKGAAQKEK